MYIWVILISINLISCKYADEQNKRNENITDSYQKEAVPIILDTDIAEDYDDVGAMGMLHALADRGEVRILATIASNTNELVGPTLSVINTYFGRPDIPIGAPKNSGVNRGTKLGWPDSLIAHYPHKYNSTDEVPDAVKTYREILSKQPDSSVTIVTIGFLTNMQNLLMSEPDSFSSLNGKELVSKKVKHWVAMAGKFPQGKEYNVMKDPSASEYAIDNWPTPIIFSGFEIGNRVLTGIRLINKGPKDSPVRMAYAISISKRPSDKNGRKSWDQTALLVAARGFDPYYSYEKGKYITQPDGSNKWKDDPDGNHIRLVELMPPDSVAYVIESLMMHSPTKN